MIFFICIFIKNHLHLQKLNDLSMAQSTITQAQFTALAIGATAKDMGITATELYNRLKRVGLIKRLLIDCYDVLHTESINGVIWNVKEALKNWEAKFSEKGGRK